MKKSYIFLLIILLSPVVLLAQRVIKSSSPPLGGPLGGVNLVTPITIPNPKPKPYMSRKISLPIVWTTNPINVSFTNADGGGDVADDGQDPGGVTARGVCWNFTGNPTIASDPFTVDGSGTGVFSSLIVGMDLFTHPIYYVRAYATNTFGTGYGNEIGFSTLPNCGPWTDASGNNYSSIMINGKCFLRENLSTTKYRDGTDIPEETVDANWALLTSGAYCWWSNDISYKVPFGALYNWYAIDPATNGGKELCMTGWHVATEADLNALTSFLGVSSGDKLKEIGTLHWFAGNNGTNSSGFTALPAGNRDNSGVFSVDIYYEGDYWTSTTSTANNAKYALFYYNSSSIVITAYSKKYGNPVRCAKD